jgi:hypothetical protein
VIVLSTDPPISHDHAQNTYSTRSASAKSNRRYFRKAQPSLASAMPKSTTFVLDAPDSGIGAPSAGLSLNYLMMRKTRLRKRTVKIAVGTRIPLESFPAQLIRDCNGKLFKINACKTNSDNKRQGTEIA